MSDIDVATVLGAMLVIMLGLAIMAIGVML